MAEYCTKQGYTEAPLPLRGLGALWPCSGVLRPPETPCGHRSIRPFGTVCAAASWLWRIQHVDHVEARSVYQDPGLGCGA